MDTSTISTDKNTKSLNRLKQAYEELTGVKIPDIPVGVNTEVSKETKKATDEIIKFLGDRWAGYYEWQLAKAMEQIEKWRAVGVEKNLIDQAILEAREAYDEDYWRQQWELRAGYFHDIYELREIDYGNLEATMIKEVALTQKSTKQRKSAYAQMYADLEAQMELFTETEGVLLMAFVESLDSALHTASAQIASQIVEMQGTLKDVWVAMAKDFMKYFIQAVLEMVAKVLVVKLVKSLGGIFDTRANDMVAYKQGADFMGYFTKGALETLQGANLGQRIAGYVQPVNMVSGNQYAMQTAGDFSQSPTSMNVNVNISGTIIGEETYVRERLIPIIEKSALAGYSRIKIKGVG